MGCVSSGDASGKETKAKASTKEKDKKEAKLQNADYKHKMTFLGKVPLFKRLPKEQLPILASNCTSAEFKAQQTIIKQGELGAEFYVIEGGEASVWHEQNGNKSKVASLKAGDYFGEGALLRDEPRAATVVADTLLNTYTITRDKFRELGLNEKLIFANRKAVGGGGARNIEVKNPCPKTPEQKELIASALRKNPNIQCLVTLDETRQQQIVEVAWSEAIPAGTELITVGDLHADYFYIVQEGSFEIYLPVEDNEPKPQSAEKALSKTESKYFGTIEKGGSFGELALLYLVPRAATVKSKEDSVVWVIDRNNFKSILLKVSDEKIEQYTIYLDRVQLLDTLLKAEKKAIAQALTEMHFAKGETIIQQGDVGRTFHILYDGEVAIEKDGVEQNRLTASKSRQIAQFFGERALLNNEPRAATVKVTSESARALTLDRDAFNMLLGPLENIMKAGAGREANLEKPKAQAGKSAGKISRGDLVKIGLLGCGGFGVVELWEHRKTQETYAMKGISKGYIVKTCMQESVMNEKHILLMTNSSFIIKLFETYNGSQSIYFLMEPALGGELYATYNRKGFHGNAKYAKYYSAGVVYAFSHLHERHIIYRDLKPENLLLTEMGHIKLTDMGLAKFVVGKTYTTCGTPDYFAPELISSSGHTNGVDWWTLGVLLFELMSGHPPFESAYPMQIYAKVMKGIEKVEFPRKCTGPIEELVKSLLKKEMGDRLPMRPGGVQNLMKHKWYQDFDWDAMKNLTLEPPYRPVVKSKKDIANFSNARKEDMPRQIEWKDDGSGWDKEFAS